MSAKESTAITPRGFYLLHRAAGWDADLVSAFWCGLIASFFWVLTGWLDFWWVALWRPREYSIVGTPLFYSVPFGLIALTLTGIAIWFHEEHRMSVSIAKQKEVRALERELGWVE